MFLTPAFCLARVQSARAAPCDISDFGRMPIPAEGRNEPAPGKMGCHLPQTGGKNGGNAKDNGATLWIIFHLSEDKQDILNMSSLGLAYLGTRSMRSWSLLAVSARASSPLGPCTGRPWTMWPPRQAALLKSFAAGSPARRTQVFKRGRNANPHSHPRGATRREYQVATGLEALFGWLYLRGETRTAQ